MKKIILISFVMIAILFVFSCVQSVYAIDLNLINSIRENEISTAENLAIDNSIVQENTLLNNFNNGTLETAENNTLNTVDSRTLTTNTIGSETVNPTTVTTTTTPTANTLSVANILTILLIVVGFLLILLGIAIMIRLKK